MGHNTLTSSGFRTLVLVGMAALLLTGGRAYSQDPGPVLLLQVGPSESGTITPGAGAHHYQLNSTVVVTAVAEPGYQFVYWLGDVDDPMSSSTFVHLDSPKIVIAIFKRAAFGSMGRGDRSLSSPFGRRFGPAGDYSRGGFGNFPGARRPSTPSFFFPTPPDFNDFPVPVPEPASVLLLFGGSIFALRKWNLKSECKSRAKKAW